MIKDCAAFTGIDGDALDDIFPTEDEAKYNIKALMPWLRSMTTYIVKEGPKRNNATQIVYRGCSIDVLKRADKFINKRIRISHFLATTNKPNIAEGFATKK